MSLVLKKIRIYLFTIFILLNVFSLETMGKTKIYKFDAKSYLDKFTDIEYKYDVLTLIVSLQGIVNRNQAKLFINYNHNDLFWFDYIKKNAAIISNSTTVQIYDIYDLLNVFKKEIKGVVLWDPNVPATSNVAATICGVERLIPVRKDIDSGSLYKQIVLSGPKLKVRKDLTGMFTGTGMIPEIDVPSTGSKKADAYRWAKENYLDKGLCNDSILGYTVDAWPWVQSSITDLNNAMVVNHDYLISRKVFFFDLSPWGDEKPVDDKLQPLGTDLKMFKEILSSQYRINGGDKITTICGFTPWEYKYTTYGNSGKHGGVATEWEQIKLQSAFNAIIDADAPSPQDISNASFYQHFPLRKRYKQKKKVNKKLNVENKNYILFYMGDWDGSAWMAGPLVDLWSDKSRGEIPLMWAFNPNLSNRIPVVFDWIYKTRTKNDYIVSGDSGAGYLNPSLLLENEREMISDLPSGIVPWIKHNQYYFKKFDLSIVGFIINGNQDINRRVQEAYSQFAKEGVVFLPSNPTLDKVVNGTPFISMTADIYPGDLDKAAKVIYDNTTPGESENKKNKPHFYVFRAIRIPPSEIKHLIEKIQGERPNQNFEIVDPYSFFYLYKKHVRGVN